MLEPRIHQHFIDSADLSYQAAESLSKPIAEGVQALMACITNGGKVLAGGVGSAAFLAPLFVRYFWGPMERPRPELAALVLTATAPPASQVRALGLAGDVLLIFSAQAQAPEWLEAIATAHDREMTVVAVTGPLGNDVGTCLLETDVHIAVANERMVRILETHLLVLHCLCDGVDAQLLGDLEVQE
jgi:D-sedoheptulose 7-phosphate isomerase